MYPNCLSGQQRSIQVGDDTCLLAGSHLCESCAHCASTRQVDKTPNGSFLAKALKPNAGWDKVATHLQAS